VAKLRIMLAEDHDLVSQGMKAMLQRRYVVLDPVRDGAAVVAAVKKARPDVLLLDLSLPGRNGLDLIPELRQSAPDTAIVVVTMHTDFVVAKQALALGAAGFMPKDSGIEELQEAITEVLAGRRYLSPRIERHAVQPSSPDREGWSRLTPRHKAILRAIALGRTTEEIAEELGISVHTIHFHRRNIRRILGIESENGLTRFAVVMQMGSEDG
jgi:DNA-binding NarL/FixJ family response regulator